MPQKKKNIIRNAFEVTREKVGEVRDASEKKIQDSPFASIAIAAGIGALIGLGIGFLVSRPEKTFFDRLRDY